MNKEKYVYSVFQSIADGYDSANERISLGMHRRWKKAAVKMLFERVPYNSSVLDIGCGTGDMLLIMYELARKAVLTGVDFSPNMLKIAKKRCNKIPGLSLKKGNACHLPFPDESFGAATISFALRNTADYEKVVEQVFRVLKKNGVFVCIDSFVPENRLVYPFYRLYFSLIVPYLGGGKRKVKQYKWLNKSTMEFLTPRQLQALLVSKGFEDTCIKSFMFGACNVIIGKKRG